MTQNVCEKHVKDCAFDKSTQGKWTNMVCVSRKSTQRKWTKLNFW